MDDGSGGVDHGFVAWVGFVAAHGDALELLEFAEEVFDEVSPLVHLLVDLERVSALRALRNDDLGAAFVHVFDDPIGIISFVGDQRAELDAVDERRDADRVVAIARQQLEAHEIAERVGQRDDLRRPAAFRLADGLALSPPLAPCP